MTILQNQNCHLSSVMIIANSVINPNLETTSYKLRLFVPPEHLISSKRMENLIFFRHTIDASSGFFINFAGENYKYIIAHP